MKVPKNVAILGLGASRMSYSSHSMRAVHDKGEQKWEEVWTINGGFEVYRHDMVFHMDDLRLTAERLPQYGEALKAHDRPIMTSTPYDEFPSSETYPIKEVVREIGNDFFPSTAVYAIAYAMVFGVKNLYIYGCDFHYKTSFEHEMGGQATTYLLGMAGP